MAASTMQVHHCRFVEAQPSAVQCMAVSHDQSLLAVGRDNGSIEIWNIKNEFYYERTIWTGAFIRRVGFLRPAEGFQVPPRTVISVGLDGVLRSYDLNSLQETNSWQIGTGAIWDLVVVSEEFPSGTDNTTALRFSDVAIMSCDDGSVRLFFVPRSSDIYPINSILPPQTILRSGGQRLVSVATGKSSDGLTRWVWAGSAKGQIYRWDLKYSESSDTGFTQSPTPALVIDMGPRSVPWAIKVMSNEGSHTIFVGDSDGKLTLWDGNFGTRLQQLQHHAADILQIVSDPSNEIVYTAGADNNITVFQKSTAKKGSAPWIFVAFNRRLHTHDIFAMVSTKTHVFTAGIDAIINVHAYSESIKLPGVTLYPFLKRPVATAVPIPEGSRAAGRMMVQLDTSLQIWRLGRSLSVAGVQDSDDEDEEKAQGQQIVEQHSLLLEVRPTLDEGEVILSSAIARDCSRVALSDSKNTKVFYLTVGGRKQPVIDDDESDDGFNLGGEDHIAVHRKRVIPGRSLLLAFTQSGQLIRATQDHIIEVYDIATKPHLVHSFDQHSNPIQTRTSNSESEKLPAPICSLAVSADGQWLASGDLNNQIHIFNLDTMQHHSTLPIWDKQHTVLAFSPLGASLVVALAGNKFLIWNVEEKRLSKFSQEKQLPNSLPLSDSAKKSCNFFGITFDPQTPSRFVLYSDGFLLYVDTEKAMNPVPRENKSSKSSRFWKIIEKFHPILACEYIGANAIAVVERPWLKVQAGFPPAFYQKKFAT